MNDSRFGTITVHCFLLLLLTTINGGYSLTVPNKDDRFTINITMTNFEITKVCLTNTNVVTFVRV